MTEDANTSALLATLDAEQAALRALLNGKNEASLARRPPNGNWSVMENVRHLLFAEQAHLGGFFPDSREWSPYGLANDGLLAKKTLRPLGTATPSTVAEVLAAWQEIHTGSRRLAEIDSAKTRVALQKHLKHFRGHVKVIERQLRQVDAERHGIRDTKKPA